MRCCKKMVGVIGSAFVLTAASGCQFGEALIDGAYGGISDTVAGALSTLLLGGLGL